VLPKQPFRFNSEVGPIDVFVTEVLTIVPIIITCLIVSLTKGAFREGTFGRRSECGARARMNAIRSRAALGHRSTGKRTGLRGARLTGG
jgi:hypothetical protein